MPAYIDPAHSAEQDPQWRLQIEQAWRSPAAREKFQADTGKPPVPTDSASLRKFDMRGYHEAFSLWATREYKLESLAPPDVVAKLK